MAVHNEQRAEKAFQKTGLNNPLRKLGIADRKLLFAVLFIYGRASAESDKEFSKPLEAASRICADARKLAAELESIFQGPAAGVFRGITDDFKDLPKVLVLFAEILEKPLKAIGKPGHKNGFMEKLFLLAASEFVRLKTGSFNDEHVAELFQAVNPSRTVDFSGHAIRKKRKYLQTRFPEMYAESIKHANRWVSTSPD